MVDGAERGERRVLAEYGAAAGVQKRGGGNNVAQAATGKSQSERLKMERQALPPNKYCTCFQFSTRIYSYKQDNKVQYSRIFYIFVVEFIHFSSLKTVVITRIS